MYLKDYGKLKMVYVNAAGDIASHGGRAIYAHCNDSLGKPHGTTDPNLEVEAGVWCLIHSGAYCRCRLDLGRSSRKINKDEEGSDSA